MPWNCKLVDPEEVPDKGFQIGDMYFARHEVPEEFLSPEYIRDWKGKRKPLWVCLPYGGQIEGGWPFCVDSKATGKDIGWTVTGEAPKITVKPSINAVGDWHGWITDGVISDG